ncbi:MAG TPA: DUF2062 domain-containing protein [Candidatus Limnocylindria bacterium]|nr:DUF2062 domain-containing protein [Candidatus Limnocylindria bacterium]
MSPRPGRTPLERCRRIFRYIYLRLIRVGGDPVHIALGFSLGVFLGVFPTFGIGIPLALLLASALRWNRVSAMLGSLVMNPITTPLFWTLSGMLGAAIFRVNANKVMTSVQNGERLRSLTVGAGIYLVGNTIIALVSAVIAYFLALRVVTVYRKRRRERKRRIREERG